MSAQDLTASGFAGVPTVLSMLPASLRYDFIHSSEAFIKSHQFVEYYPDNRGQSYSYNSQARIDWTFQGTDMLDLLQSEYQVRVKVQAASTFAADGEDAPFLSEGPAPWLEQLIVSAGGRKLEDITSYNLLHSIVDNCTVSNAKRWTDVGHNYGSKLQRQLITCNNAFVAGTEPDTWHVTNSTLNTEGYDVSLLPYGFHQVPQLVPLSLIGSLRVRMQLARNEDVVKGKPAVPASSFTYTLENLVFRAKTVELQDEAKAALMASVQSGGLGILYHTFVSNQATISTADRISTKTVLQGAGRVKSVLSVLRRQADIGDQDRDALQCFVPGGSAATSLERTSWKVGSRKMPQYDVEFEGAAAAGNRLGIDPGASQMYRELERSLGTLHQPAVTGRITPQVYYPKVDAMGVYGDGVPYELVDRSLVDDAVQTAMVTDPADLAKFLPKFIMGIDLSADSYGGRISGVDLLQLGSYISQTLQFRAAPSEAMFLESFCHMDRILHIDGPGSVKVIE